MPQVAYFHLALGIILKLDLHVLERVPPAIVYNDKLQDRALYCHLDAVADSLVRAIGSRMLWILGYVQLGLDGTQTIDLAIQPLWRRRRAAAEYDRPERISVVPAHLMFRYVAIAGKGDGTLIPYVFALIPLVSWRH
jgi:hypothetical protein